jgi:hypothetical protein
MEGGTCEPLAHLWTTPRVLQIEYRPLRQAQRRQAEAVKIERLLKELYALATNGSGENLTIADEIGVRYALATTERVKGE